MAATPRPEQITRQYIQSVCQRLVENQRVRRRLPQWGRIHIDRQLPFLCVYRRRDERDAGTDGLVVGEASYLTASADPALRRDLASLVQHVAETLAGVFGAFLVLEIWAGPDPSGPAAGDDAPGTPAFRIHAPHLAHLSSTIEVLENALGQIRIHDAVPVVDSVVAGKTLAPGLTPLIPPRRNSRKPVHVIGLEIQPIYRNGETGRVYPVLHRTLHRELSQVFKRTFFEYTRSHTTDLPPHYLALGRRAMVKAVWEVDRRLAEISSAFDFLLGVTPVNATEAANAFKRSRFERAPVFVYRPLVMAPGMLKRALYAIPLERIEDPALGQLFRGKQSELDRQLTALNDRDTSRFLFSTLQMFGTVDDALLGVAKKLLDRISPHARETSGTRRLDATAFARRAEQEIAHYRGAHPALTAKVQLRDDISGLMVSHGNLFVSRDTSIPASRVEPLLQHEVGTHVLTYFNGRAQPLRQLYSGLAGYEELQEGIAVLAEYLVGGLSAPRLRLLAARVVAVRNLIDGASFVETFRELDRGYQFSQPAAFSITMRVYRAGGLVKDAIYLRGLGRLLEYLRKGGELEPLLIGKISADHVGLMRELLWRGVLRPPPLRPRYLDDAKAVQRLARLRTGVTLLELLPRKGRES